MKIVECVPNFSEGRDQAIIDAIASAIRSASGVTLLDVDPGKSTNRTVYTFAGPPEALLQAAFEAIKTGCSLIDMRKHKGEHARQGACDVCPFIPISDVTMDECVELANKLAGRVADELNLPVYLYAKAAKKPERFSLPTIREGEYEGLEKKLKDPQWKPDFGPAEFNAKSGAITIGARKFLIAYNINLNTTTVKIAKEIAHKIRESGYVKRDKNGKPILNKDGTKAREKGLFKNLQGTGWLIPEYNRAQITMNILDIDETKLHLVYDKVIELANDAGCRVTGSEIVGLVPKQVIIEAGRFFLEKQRATTGVPEDAIINNAVISLGLNDVSKFNPDEKIIERKLKPMRPLIDMTLGKFCDELSSNSPAPGGGSVAALGLALSSGLSSMVAALTYEKKGFEGSQDLMKKVGDEAQSLITAGINAVDDDTNAFNKVMSAFKLPKGSDDEKKLRSKAIEEANKGATLEPLNTLKNSLKAIKIAGEMVEKGNPNSLSDAGVAALMAHASGYGAYYNVLINLKGISDKKWCEKIKKEADSIIAEIDKISEKARKTTMERLG